MKILTLNMLVAFTFFLSCTPQEKTPSKLEIQYNQVQLLLNENEMDLYRLFAQLPIKMQKELKESMKGIQENTFSEMMKKENNNDKNLRLLLASMEKFMVRLGNARAFHPNEEQTKLYNELRNKVLKDKKVVDEYLSKPADPNNAQEIAIKILLRNIRNNRIASFKNVSLMSSQEFDRAIGDLNREWETVKTNLVLDDLYKEFDRIMKQ